MKQPTLNDLTSFLLLAEHLNFRRAAAALEITPSALSHTIRILEGRIGAQLLMRTTRSVALTEAGARLAGRLRPLLSGIDAALGELAERRDRLSGRISISTMEFGGRLLVERVIGGFRDAHPDVEFEISVQQTLVDLVASGCDAGVRLREQVPPDMVAVSIGPPVAMVACASPDYLRRWQPPLQPRDLADHECIRQRLASGAIYRWEFEHAGRPIVIEPQGSLTCNDIGVMVSAALSGQGVAFTTSHHVGRYLDTGQLVQVLAEYSPPFDGLCLYYPSSRHPTRAFSAFVAHLRGIAKTSA